MPWQYPVHGIDVSKYQGDIDWSAVAPSGVDFAFIKATEGGDHADERFVDNWEAAGAAGLPRGAYHYYYFCRAGARAGGLVHQPRAARRPRAAAGPRPRMDAQVASTCTFRPDAASVQRRRGSSSQALTAYYGKRPVIYTTVDFYRDNELWRLDLSLLAALGRRASV